MKTTGLIGRTIVRIHQRRGFDDAAGGAYVDLVAIELDDGSVLRFSPFELSGDLAVAGIYPGRRIEPGEANIVAPK